MQSFKERVLEKEALVLQGSGDSGFWEQVIVGGTWMDVILDGKT